MLLQLHWQFKDGTTEMRAQREFDLPYDEDESRKLRHWIGEVQAEHPLPEGACWTLVKEDSKLFVGTRKEE
jgi:hypothetical protein